jgi:hypothetical protein
MIMHTFSIVLNFGTTTINSSCEFCLYPRTRRIISIILKKIRSEIVESGCSFPKTGNMVFIKRPNPRIKEIDNPTL